MDPADFRTVFDQIPVALWNTGTIENHLTGRYFDASFRKFEEGFSRGNVEKLIVFAMLPPMAISSAVAAMTAQNYGAGLRVRMNRCLYAGIGMALVFGVSVCLYSQFLPDTLTGIFTRDSEVVQMASGYLRGYSIDCIMVSFVFCINSYFSGQGNSLGQFRVPHGTQRDFHLPLPHTFVLRLQSGEFFFFVSHGVCSSVVHFGFADDMHRVYEIQEKKGNYSGLCVRKLLKTDEGKTYFP